MQRVTLIEEGDHVVVTTPYYPPFVDEASDKGGKWDISRGVWIFPKAYRPYVEQMLYTHFRTKGTPDEPTCTLQIEFTKGAESEYKDSLYFSGYRLAKASSRDSGARLGDGILLLQGKARSGGSAKYWTTVLNPGSVVHILEYPLEHAKEIAGTQDEEGRKFSIWQEGN